VEVGLQEAVDILTAATKGCGSYAKPILRHITTVAEFAKRDGVQVCNLSDLHGLSAMCTEWMYGMECCVIPGVVLQICNSSGQSVPNMHIL